MRKVLLFLVAVLVTTATMAQTNAKLNPTVKKEKAPQRVFEPVDNTVPVSLPSPIEATKSGPKNVVIRPIGQAGNAYSFYANGRTYIWADNDLNTVSFVHRMLNPPGTGFLSYDISKDGGATWVNNIQVYDPNLTGADNARYPQGVIYNPSGNLNPDSAYFAYWAPVLDASNGASWGGYGYGVHKLDSSMAPTQTNKASHGSFLQEIPDAFTINADGKTWMVDNAAVDALFAGYMDTLIINVGTFNDTIKDFEYAEFLHYAPSSLENTGDRVGFTDLKVAFAPDGLTGYISMLGHNDYTLVPDSAYYPILYKTIDGGVTWTGPINVQMSLTNGISAIKNFIPDSIMVQLFTTMPDRDSVIYTTAFDHDLVVDINGNAHIAVAVGLAAGGWSISSGLSGQDGTSGIIGVFDIYTTDGGSSWDAWYLSPTMTFRGYYPGGGSAAGTDDISEDTRPQVSRTMDGKKVFFTWLDTDIEIIPGMGNSQPDIYLRGIDVTNMNKTVTFNVTDGTTGQYVAHMGSQSHYVFSSSGTYTIPMVYQEFGSGADPLLPVQYYFVDGFTLTDADFIPNPGIYEVEDLFSSSYIYPNPASDNVNIDIRLEKSGNVSVEVLDMLGKVVYAEELGTMFPGQHKLNIGVGNFENGMYFVKVNVNKQSVTHKLLVD